MELRPILATKDGNIYAGNMRYRAAKHLGWQDIPAILTDIPEKLAKERALKDNNQFGEWQMEDLSAILSELEGLGTEMDTLGLPDSLTKELEALGPTETVEDEPPPAPSEPTSKIGDLYQLGDHRLLCGDATKIDDVERLMDGFKADAVLTDPPYGQNQEGVPGDEPENLEHVIEAVAILPVENAAVVTFQSTRTFPAWLNKACESGLKFERMLWLSKKAQMAYPWRGWILNSECILIHSKGEPNWNDMKPYVHDTYELPYVAGELPKDIGWHGSVKPQVVLQDIIQRISMTEQIVLDPFGGSGSTLIACEQLKRKCYMMELEPRYADVIVKRWETFAGKSATLLPNG